MTSHTIKLASDDKVSYWTYHDDKRPVLILVHGFTGSHEGFQYLVPLLSDYRLIIPDLPGFGISPLPHNRLSLAHLGELLIDFIESLGLDAKPHLLGHSMGSLVAAEAVRLKPDIFAKKLILISPVPSPIKLLEMRRPGAVISQLYYVASHRLPVVGKRLATSRKLTRLSTRMIITTKNKILRKAIYDHHFNNLNFISSIEWYSWLYHKINLTGITRYKATLRPFDILLISGELDKVTPLKHQKRAANTIDAKFIVIPGVGHLAHYEKPKELVKTIADFLQ